MSYKILHCKVCGCPVHVHENGRIRSACEHVRAAIVANEGNKFPLAYTHKLGLVPFGRLSPALKELWEKKEKEAVLPRGG